MKNKYVFVFVMLFSILVVSLGFTNIYVGHHQQADDEDFVVVTSFYPMYIAAMNVVGNTEGVTLKNLSEPQTGCLHDFQLTPADMKLLSTADVFIINGGGIESFMEDIAKQYPELMVIDASVGIEFLCGEYEHDHDHDHEAENSALHRDEHVVDGQMIASVEVNVEESHGITSENKFTDDQMSAFAEANVEKTHESEDSHEGHDHDINAHVWMSVANYRQQVENIAEGLAEAYEEKSESFLANAGIYDEKLEALQAEQEKLLTLTTGEEIILFHSAYDYAAKDLGMETVFCMDLDEERQVSAGEVAEVLEAIEHHGVKYIFAEELYGSSMCEMIQKEVDVTVVYLDPLNRGEYDADSYILGMRNNLKLIYETFQ